jgi:uncharacterized protein
MMALTPTLELAEVAQAVGEPLHRVEAVVALLDDGNTVPFITRYRKDQTGGMDEERIRAIQTRVLKLRMLMERKHTILRSIESQGKLTPELVQAIHTARSARELEDIYLPYKPNKQTLATAARNRGLEEMAREILTADPAALNLDGRAADFVNPDRHVATAADALLGAGHILAEWFSERADVRRRLRQIMEATGRLVTSAAVAAGDAPKKPSSKKRRRDKEAYRDFFQYSEAVGQVPPHRVLAINRGEAARALRVHIEADMQAMHSALDELLVPEDHPHAEFLRGCARDALARLIYPSLERELRRELTERAEAHAVQVFACNLRNLLLQAPVRDRRVLAVDPGFRNGCKLAALDDFGNLLETAEIHLLKEAQRADARKILVEMVEKHRVSIIAIGNGAACRQTEAWISDVLSQELAGRGIAYVIVNEAGASVYSTGPVGREEFPHLDAALRSAVSIGRRLQDPLSELVKIEPCSIGVGMYQHDVKARHLRASLDDVVASCVNFVGVDLNTASPALLRYVSGLNQLTAQRIFEYRQAHGPFKCREELKQVVGIGESTYVQAAGFLKITGGTNPLDATWIHPESYPAAERILARWGLTPAALADRTKVAALAESLAKTNLPQLAKELGVGELTLGDIIAQLSRPGRDPRESLPQPVFKRGVLKLEDLVPDMELRGTVLNVVDFGAFVDIGVKWTGLVHVSQLAPRYVKDPHEVVAVGDTVQVWVREVDRERRRVSLSMVSPQERAELEARRRRPHVLAGGTAGHGPPPPRSPRPAAGGGGPARRRSSEHRGRRQAAPTQPCPPAQQSGFTVTGAAAEGSALAATATAAGSPTPGHATGEENAPAGSPATEDALAPVGQENQQVRRTPLHGERSEKPPRGGKPRQRESRPRPVPVLTEAMKQGKAPLRTFGELAQFLALRQQQPPAEDASGS